ncbi:MAG: DUF2851 family protein [Parachlamydiaceae bacterium]
MDNLYAKLLPSILHYVAEEKHTYHFLTERHIQALWFEQKYFENLKTLSNETIEIISPGIWNLDAGPDFRKAHFKIGKHEYFGDIEIHLSDESWEQHKHHCDPNYNQVVLHISFWAPRRLRSLMTLTGTPIVQVYLENFLTVPIAKLTHLIDLDLYPYKKFVGSGRCAQDVFKQLSSEETSRFFEKAADWRLFRKRQYLQSRIDDPSLYMPAGIAMALGYKNNSEQFLSLFLEMQSLHFGSEQETLAWLMAKTGFFSTHFQDKWGRSSYYHELKKLSEKFERAKLVSLHLTQIRPLNHPIRRLVTLAKIYQDATLTLLFPRILSEWKTHWQKGLAKQKWKSLIDVWKQCLPCYTDDYWNHHFLFEELPREQTLSLMGDDLRREIVVNLFFPFLEEYLVNEMNMPEIKAFEAFYRSLPPSKSGKSHYLSHRYFGNSPKGALLKNAYTEQGAFQLHYDFCSHYEASCEGCPFVERYNKHLRGRL